MKFFKEIPKVWRVIIIQLLIIYIFATIYTFIDYKGFNKNFSDNSN